MVEEIGHFSKRETRATQRREERDQEREGEVTGGNDPDTALGITCICLT